MPDVRMPDGTIIRNVPANATREQIAAAHAKAKQAGAVEDNRPKSFWRGVADSAGNALANYEGMVEKFTRPSANTPGIFDAARLAANKVTSALGLPSALPSSQQYRAMARDESAQSKYRGSALGNLAGGLAASAPTFAIPGGPLLQGAAGGALLSSDPDDPKQLLLDTTIGGVTGKGGQLFGSRVAAPVAERIGRTAPAQAIKRGVNAAASQISNRLPTINLPNPKFTRPERAVLKAAPKLGEAQRAASAAARLKLPFAPADAAPELQQLAGSVARYSPSGRALAEKTFNQRATDQADRAVAAIDEHLAPVTDIEQRAADIIERGKPQYGPLYDKAYAIPPIISPELQKILNTPAGKQAISRANTIAANEYRNPKELGFILDKDGNVALEPSLTLGSDEAGSLISQQEPMRQMGYSTQSLDYVKRGLDDIIEQHRDPISGKLKMDEGLKAINGVKNDLLREMDSLNPDYAAARATYKHYADQAGALRTGHDVLPNSSLPQRNFDRIVGRATDDTRPELQRGHATAMADTANRYRLTNDPYKAIYGSTDQQGKVGTLFPEGADDFNRIYELEGTMAQTRQKALGGSQTQANKVTDDQFASGALANALDAGLRVASGGVTGGVKLASLAARKAWNPTMGFAAERKATAMAPQMFDTDPAATLAFFNELERKQAEQQARALGYRKAGGLFGRGAGYGAGVSLLTMP